MNYININEFEKYAAEKLTKMNCEFISGGADAEITLIRNKEVFNEIQIVPQVLGGVVIPDSKIKLLNFSLQFPLMGGPAAFQCLAHSEGEVAVAKALNKEGLAYTTSVMSTISLEKIIDASQCPSWFQLYIFKDKNLTLDLIKRAENSGYQGIVVTVDMPIMGKRIRDIKNNFCLPPNLSAANFTGKYLSDLFKNNSGSAVKKFTDIAFDGTFSWDYLEYLKLNTKLPIIIKGIMRSSDAKMAIDYGAEAIIVSNHGGRQLDSIPSSMELLVRIKKEISDKIPVLVDGGITKGTDILKAIALGADCVLIVRPLLWGLAVAGEKGVARVLQIFKKEFIDAMILCGYKTVDEVRKDKELILWNYLRN